MDERIRIGISACLLGEKVRWDGGHKLDPFLRDTLGQRVGFIAVCPEAECGLGVPREPMHLVGDPDAPRLVAENSGTDHTGRMNAWTEMRLEQLAGEDLDGFIFKAKSPSCGIERIKVFGPGETTAGLGAGIFARRFTQRFPLIPVEDEVRLQEPGRLENFIERAAETRRRRRT